MSDKVKENVTNEADAINKNSDKESKANKNKEFNIAVTRLLRYLKKTKFQIFVVFFMILVSLVFTIASPKILSRAIDKIAEGAKAKLDGVPNAAIDFLYVGKIITILIFLYIISSLFMFLYKYIMASVTKNVTLKIRKEVGEKLNRLPLRYFDSNSHGDILSRVSNDIDIISSAIKENVPMFISATVNVIGLIIMMLSINPLITLIPVISSIIGFIYIIIIMSTSNTYFVGQRKAIGKISGYVEEIYQGHKIIKSFRREKSSIDTFSKMNEELNQLTWKAQFYSGILSPGIYFIMNFEYVLICIFGGILAVNGKLSVGKILAFIQYSKDSFDPVLEIADSIGAMQAGVAAAQRVFEILDEPEEIEDIAYAEVKNVHEGKVVIENVNFGYKKEVTVINNLSVSVKSGQVVAIVGSTGAGKTTLINLLMRFYELDSGRIMIDDTDITQLKRQDLRKFFGMVLQDTWLFSGTIKENITYGRENASDEEIIAASKAAHAHHFIKTLPDGYNTVLSEDASNISQGQKQLLTIARAILTNPTVLILDEATSNVDTRTEVHIQKAMKELMKGRTSFVIAHRLSTIREADIILVMKDGKIIEQGRHEELMSKKGTYYDLHNSQFSDNNINSAENVCC